MRKKYLYFLPFFLLFSIVLGAKFVFSQKPSFEIAPSPGPTIQNTTVSPALGLLGTIFTITTQASDVSGIGSVIAHIQNPDETDVAQVTLYDDGAHSDGAANDGTYGASWDSDAFPGGTYYIDIVANDTLGYFTEDENGASFNLIANYPPIADARVGSAPNPTGKRVSVVAGDTVYFDGSTYSKDSDGTITKYEWDFENNGVYDWSSAVTGITTHVYSVGSYTAKLRVTDDDGATATDTVYIDRVFGCACETWENGSCGGGIFNDDFETYNLGNLKGQGGWYYDPNNCFQVQTEIKYEGEKGVNECLSDIENLIVKIGENTEIGVFSIRVYPTNETIGSENILVFALRDRFDYQETLLQFRIKKNGEGHWILQYRDGISPYPWIDFAALKVNEWNLIAVKWNIWFLNYKIMANNVYSEEIDFFDYLNSDFINGIDQIYISVKGTKIAFDNISNIWEFVYCLATQKSRTRTCKPFGCSTEFDCDGNAATCGAFFPPSSFDWSHKVLPGAPPAGGADWMSPVKNQGAWDVATLFASTGVMEAKYNIQQNNPNLDIDLSEQYIDACLQTSLLENILRYTGGPTDEACLPYQAKSVSCEFRCTDWNKRLWDLTGVNITNGNRDEIKYALINYGPLRVTIDMAHWNPITYSCGASPIVNHVAVIVGYDDAEGVWIVRNSWGSGWGIGGYFKVKYGECLIDDEAVAIDGLIAP